jgi:hypothetical protein
VDHPPQREQHHSKDLKLLTLFLQRFLFSLAAAAAAAAALPTAPSRSHFSADSALQLLFSDDPVEALNGFAQGKRQRRTQLKESLAASAN